MFNRRICLIQPHEQPPEYQLCTITDCYQSTRWICSECTKGDLNRQCDKSDIKNQEKLEEIIQNFKNNNIKRLNNIKRQSQIQQFMLNVQCIGFLNQWIIKQMNIQEVKTKIQQFNNEQDEQINMEDYLRNLNQNNIQIYEYLEQFQSKISNIDDLKNNVIQSTQLKQKSNSNYYEIDGIEMAYQMKLFLTNQNSQLLSQDEQFQIELEKYLAEQKIQNQGKNQYSDDNTDDYTDDNTDIQNDTFSLSKQQQIQEAQQMILSKNNTDSQFIQCQTNINQEQLLLEIIQNKQEEFKINELKQFKEKLQTEDENQYPNQSIEKAQLQNKIKYFQLKIDVIVSASISFDEKYLGFCSCIGQLQIYVIEENQLKKLHEIKAPTACIFKPNSHQLISGSHYGWIYCFDGLDQFKIKYQQQIHNDTINCIIFIDEFTIITCSNDKQIIITDLQNKQQLLKISDAHENNVMFIDYNKSMKIIASCSHDKSIKLWNLNGNPLQIINEAHQDFIMQIQIIQPQGYLLSLCLKGELKLWEFQYEQEKIKSLLEQNEKIFYFYYFQEKSNIILVCQKYLKILNIHFQIVKIINNDMNNCNQFNYLILKLRYPWSSNLSKSRKSFHNKWRRSYNRHLEDFGIMIMIMKINIKQIKL